MTVSRFLAAHEKDKDLLFIDDTHLNVMSMLSGSVESRVPPELKAIHTFIKVL